MEANEKTSIDENLRLQTFEDEIAKLLEKMQEQTKGFEAIVEQPHDGQESSQAPLPQSTNIK